MPNALDAGLLARLLASQNASPFVDGGLMYQRTDQFGGPGGEAGYGQDLGFGGALSYDPNKTNPGDEYSVYDKSGQYTNTGQFKDMSGLDPLLLAFLAAAGGMAFGLPALMGAEAAGAGAGVSGAAFGDAGLMYGGADAAAAGSLGAGGAGAGAGAAGAASATMAPMQGLTLSELGLSGGPLSTMAGVGGTSALGGLLGPAATLLGGLAGAQGTDAEQTTKKDISDWLKPYITGENGILAQTNNLLQKQMAPGYLAGYDQMRTLGTNLMNTPMVGNGYSKFFMGQ
jgi:hypothetical protein